MIPQAHFPTCNNMTETQEQPGLDPAAQQGRIMFSPTTARYTDAFKVAAIKQAVSCACVADVANALRVSKSSIFNWCCNTRLLTLAGLTVRPTFKIGRRPFRSITRGADEDTSPPWVEDTVVQSAPFSSTFKAAADAQNYATPPQNTTPFNMCFCPGCGLNLAAAQTALTAMLQEQ